MFSLTRLARVPLRRTLHTKASASSSFGKKGAFVIGASAVTASYITWQLAQSNRTYCDAPQSSSSSDSTSKSPRLSPKATPAPAPTSVTQVDVFIPDAPSDPDVVEDAPASSEPSSETESDAEASTEEGGSEDASGGASGGAYNPETGEINWDCPCLGGMAHGPCGPEFREAFSCFIHSEEEPKGIECVEKFQNMQNCFRAHPEVYADEIMRDEEDDEVPAQTDSGDAPPSDVEPSEQSADTPTPTKTEVAADIAASDS